MIDSSGLSDQVDSLEKKSQRFESPCEDGLLIIRHWPGPNEAADSVLLVHGGSGSWRHWYNNIDYLAHRFNVYAIDLPGVGGSEALTPGYSALDAVEVVSTGIQALPGFGKFHLVAFSWGCAVSSQLVRLHEDQLLSLLLVGPASIGDIPRRGLMKPLLKRHSEMSAEEVFYWIVPWKNTITTIKRFHLRPKYTVHAREEFEAYEEYLPALQAISTLRFRRNSNTLGVWWSQAFEARSILPSRPIVYGVSVKCQSNQSTTAAAITATF